jgi:hypothetical protein
MKNLNVKLYQLIDTTTNEVIVESISENVVRREWISLKEDGEDMSLIKANQTFISIEEWNKVINGAIDAIKK